MPDRRVLLATDSEWPDLGDDEQLVLPGLAARGVDASPAIWSDPSVDWAGALVVVRSTWNYIHRLDDFLRWADRVAGIATLFNPAPVIRANTDKRYLADLADAGVPVVPTEWIDRGTSRDVGAVLRERGWRAAVVKPAVSNGARDTALVTAESTSEGQQLAEAIATTRDVMIQPYLDSVETYGERSMIHIGGALSHTVRKAPMLAGASSPDDVQPAVAAADEKLLAEQALSWVGAELLYARVDIARLADGSPVIMELELTEPRLYLRYDDAADRFAAAIATLALARPPSGSF